MTENFLHPPEPRIAGEGHLFVCFFMRLFATLGAFWLYLVYTLDAATMYPVLCAFVGACGFMGPVTAELLFHTTVKHIVPHVAFFIMGTVCLLAAI